MSHRTSVSILLALVAACVPADEPSTTDSEPADPDEAPEAPPARCGDGLVQEGEECDDGDLDPEDGCTSACREARCGDGIVWAEVEACDDGDLDDDDACTASCEHARCGDGIVWSGVEACDDGNYDEEDGCAACRLARCGDGIVRAGAEACDDGEDNVPAEWARLGDCTTACAYGCGDGVASAYEACDDGDRRTGDGCSPSCEVEHPIFATRALFPADLGGVGAADARCQAAAAGKLAGTYRAWLSSTPAGLDALARLPVGRPLVRTDGALVVAAAEDLLYHPNFALLGPIDRDEEGAPVTGFAWTGTEIAGEASGLDCLGWSAADDGRRATIGALASTTLSWTHATWLAPAEQARCSADNHLYCFRADP